MVKKGNYLNLFLIALLAEILEVLNGFDYMKRTREIFFYLHKSASIIELSTVVWSRENCH